MKLYFGRKKNDNQVIVGYAYYLGGRPHILDINTLNYESFTTYDFSYTFSFKGYEVDSCQEVEVDI